MTTITIGGSARALALAAAVATSALGFAGQAHAANMPDWAADFDSAGDAFEGGGGGGGGGWRPSPLNPGTGSGPAGGVPTTCTSRPTPTGEELTCSPSYPATPLPPARPTPDYGPGIGGSGGKGLGEREECHLYDIVGARLLSDWEKHLRLWGEALGKDPAAVEYHNREMKRIQAQLEERGWTYGETPGEPDFLVWTPGCP